MNTPAMCVHLLGYTIFVSTFRFEATLLDKVRQSVALAGGQCMLEAWLPQNKMLMVLQLVNM